MSLNQRYNKTITFKPSVQKEDTQFDLCYLTYNGRLTKIVDYFNKLPVSKSKEIVSKSFDEETRRNSLQISSFLNFANISSPMTQMLITAMSTGNRRFI